MFASRSLSFTVMVLLVCQIQDKAVKSFEVQLPPGMLYVLISN